MIELSESAQNQLFNNLQLNEEVKRESIEIIES